MKTLLTEYWWIALIVIGLLILAVLFVRSLYKDAKAIEDISLLGHTQKEIDAYMNRGKDKHLNELVDRIKRKEFYKSMSEMPDKKKASQIIMDEYDNSENKREFANRSDMDEVDMEFTSHIH